MNATWLLLGQAAISASEYLFVPVVVAGGLLLFILLLAVIVAAVTQSRKAGVVVGLALTGALVLLTGVLSSLFFLRSAVSTPYGIRVTNVRAQPVERVERMPASPVQPELSPSPQQQASPAPVFSIETSGLPFSSSDPWDRVAEDTLSASVYSSAANAARALAREAAIELGSQMAETPEAIVVVLGPELNQRDPALSPQVGAVLRDAFPLASVSESADPSEAGTPERLVIRLDQPESQLLPSTGPKVETAPPSSGYSIQRDPEHWLPQATGTVRLRAVYQVHAFEGVKRYVDKPWVDQFGLFVSNHPERSLLRADCRAFASDEASAYRDAVDAAANSLLPRVRTLLRAETDPRLPHVPEDRIREQLQAAVERNELVADRFSQQLEGRFGSVWRATLLVDFQPDQLARIVYQGHLVQRTEERREIATGLSIVLMLGLVVALYIVLNELTKGYFVWNLRAAAMLTLLTMVVAFCWWIG